MTDSIRKINPLLKVFGSFLIMGYEVFPLIFFPSILKNIKALVILVIVNIFIGADIFIRPQTKQTEKDQYKTWKIYLFFVLSPLLICLPFIENIYISKLYQPISILNIEFVIGCIIAILGGFLLVGSRIIIGNYGTPKILIQNEHRLIQKGPYKILRNPMYFGDLLMYGGLAISFGAWLSFIFSIVFLLLIVIERILLEEKLLEEKFGNDYEVWKGKTWRLVPFIW